MIRLNTVLNGSYSTRMVLTSGMLQVTAGLYPGTSNRVHSCKVYRKHQGSGLKTFRSRVAIQTDLPRSVGVI